MSCVAGAAYKDDVMDSGLKTDLLHRLAGLRELAGVKWSLEDVRYDASSPTTAGLFRIRLEQRPGSMFVKVLKSYERWPMIKLVSEEFRTIARSTDLWRYEADVYLSGLSASLPPGMRLPRVHCVDMLDDDHLVLVLEDVKPATAQWDQERYGLAAELLGRLNARLTTDDILPASANRTPGQLSKIMFEGLLERLTIPVLLDEHTWSHPLLAGSRLRQNVAELAARMPSIVRQLAQRPQLMSHGDPCPQNLLIPADSPNNLVAIDWTLGGLVAAGDDLGQLLIGRAHSGELALEELTELRELVIGRYHAGLLSEGHSNIHEEDVRAGLDGSLVLRSALLSIPTGRLGEPVTDELADWMSRRLELAEYLVELGRSFSI